MSDAILTIDLNAIVENWQALNSKSNDTIATGAVVKADAYGLGTEKVGAALAKAGATEFFVATAAEGVALRKSVGAEPTIYVFSGHMAHASDAIRNYNLVPLLNSPDQAKRHKSSMPDQTFGIQLDTGMNRLGCEAHEFEEIRDFAKGAKLIISHLACADEPTHPQNKTQLRNFVEMTDGLSTRRSLAATGGTLLGSDFHFDLCRPGVGLYGGAPFTEAKPVIKLSLPVIQVRDVAMGETVGYSASWKATKNRRIATLASGYADGLIRSMGNGAVSLYAENTPCPLVGRVSMDLLTVDVSSLEEVPEYLDILNTEQKIDDLADAAGTIGYEFLTSLGMRYERRYGSL